MTTLINFIKQIEKQLHSNHEYFETIQFPEENIILENKTNEFTNIILNNNRHDENTHIFQTSKGIIFNTKHAGKKTPILRLTLQTEDTYGNLIPHLSIIPRTEQVSLEIFLKNNNFSDLQGFNNKNKYSFKKIAKISYDVENKNIARANNKIKFQIDTSKFNTIINENYSDEIFKKLSKAQISLTNTSGSDSEYIVIGEKKDFDYSSSPINTRVFTKHIKNRNLVNPLEGSQFIMDLYDNLKKQYNK